MNPKGEIPSVAVYANTLKSEIAIMLHKAIGCLGDVTKQHYESFYIHHAVDAIMATLRIRNNLLELHKPWVLKKKTDDASAEELQAVIALALEATRICALTLYPITPRLSSTALDFLRVPRSARSWLDTKPLYLNSSAPTSPIKFADEKIVIYHKAELKKRLKAV